MERHNLTDEQFGRIEHLLPGRPGGVGRPAKDNRKFVHALLWLEKTGVPWRDLPSYFGKWNSVFKRHDAWCRSGRWAAILAVLAADADTEVVAIDSTVARAHRHAAGAPKKGFPPRKAGRHRHWAARGAA